MFAWYLVMEEERKRTHGDSKMVEKLLYVELNSLTKELNFNMENLEENF